MYKCDNCGSIVTDEEYDRDQEQGSGGYCYCEYMETDPETGDVWFPRILHVMRRVNWWEMLDWNQMDKAWENLSVEIKDKIRGVGLAPNYDEQTVRTE